MKNVNQMAVGAVLSLTICVTSAWSDEKKWQENMAELGETFSELIPYVFDREKFTSKSNEDDIGENLEKFAKITKNMASHKPHGINDADPTLSVLSGMFDNEAKLARERFAVGQKEYARTVLKTVASYCISCHSRKNFGPQFNSLDGWNKMVKGLDPFDQAEFYAATRQYDKALKIYRKLIDDAQYAKKYSVNWDKSVGHALAIAVRVRNNPKLAEQITQSVTKSAWAPYFLKEYSKSWLKSIREWKRDPNRSKKNVDHLREADRLIAKAKKNQRYAVDRSAEVYYLRASRHLHQYLGKDIKNKKKLARALYLTGQAYESLDLMGLWSLDRLMYRECIKQLPHSTIAQDCYGRYEQLTHYGYSGSGGISLPGRVQNKLNRLRTDAMPKEKSK